MIAGRLPVLRDTFRQQNIIFCVFIINVHIRGNLDIEKFKKPPKKTMFKVSFYFNSCLVSDTYNGMYKTCSQCKGQRQNEHLCTPSVPDKSH